MTPTNQIPDRKSYLSEAFALLHAAGETTWGGRGGADAARISLERAAELLLKSALSQTTASDSPSLMDLATQAASQRPELAPLIEASVASGGPRYARLLQLYTRLAE